MAHLVAVDSDSGGERGNCFHCRFACQGTAVDSTVSGNTIVGGNGREQFRWRRCRSRRRSGRGSGGRRSRRRCCRCWTTAGTADRSGGRSRRWRRSHGSDGRGWWPGCRHPVHCSGRFFPHRGIQRRFGHWTKKSRWWWGDGSQQPDGRSQQSNGGRGPDGRGFRSDGGRRSDGIQCFRW